MADTTHHPLIRNFIWYNYVNGTDLRETCPSFKGEHYRLIYNAHYHKHIRWYDLVRPAAQETGYLTARYSNRGTSILQLNYPLLGANETLINDPIIKRNLSSTTLQNLVAAFEKSDAFTPSPEGMRLYSHSFYWVMIACRYGKISFHAWPYDLNQFKDIYFNTLVFALDSFSQPPPSPTLINPQDKVAGLQGSSRNRDSLEKVFILETGKNGLVTFP